MALQLGALRSALIDAGATPERAGLVAEKCAAHLGRRGPGAPRFSLLAWLAAVNVAATLLILWLVLRIPGTVG